MATSLGAATLYLDLDAKDLVQQLQSLEQRLRQVESQQHTVRVNADTAPAQAATRTLEDRINQQHTVTLSLDTTQAMSALNQLEQRMRQVQDAARQASQQIQQQAQSMGGSSRPWLQGGRQQPPQEPARQSNWQATQASSQPSATSSRPWLGGGGDAGAEPTARGVEALLQKLQQLREQGGGGLLGVIRGLAQSFGGESGKSGLAGSILGAVAALGEIGLAIEGIRAVIGLVAGAFQQAYGALDQFAQQAAEFNKTVLSMSTTTAMFNKVFVDGLEVKGAADKIKAARPAIIKELQQLQKDAMYINGATTQQLAQMMSVVLQNNGTGGDLAKARKLTASLAAGLNTFGIPGWQGEQEIRALLTGDIDMNARLANQLNIRRADVEREKAKGTYFEFLQGRLAPALAGQQIGSATLENVQSNIQDAFEMIGMRVGQPIEKALYEAFKRAFDAIADGADSMSRFGEKVASTLQPVIVAIGEITAGFINIGRVAVVGADVLMSVFGPTLRTLGALFQATFAVINALFEGLANIAEGAGAVIDALFSGKDWGGIGSKVDGFLGQLQKMLDGVVKFTEQIKVKGQEYANAIRQFFGQKPVDYNAEFKSTDLQSSTKKLLEEAQKLTESEFEYKKTRLQEYSKLEQSVGRVALERQQNILKALEGQRQVLQAVFDLENRRAQLMTIIAEGRVQSAGTEEERARRQTALDEQVYQQKERQYQQGVALLDKEQAIQAQQLRIQQLQLDLKKKELETSVKIAELEVNRTRDAIQDAIDKKGANSSEVRQLTTLLEIKQLQFKGAKAQLAVIGEQTRALGIQAQTQRDLNGLQQQGLAVQLQIDATQYRNQQTQAAIAKANRERNQRQQQLEATLKRQTEAINNQIAALQRQLDLERQSNELADARARLEKTRSEGEIGRLEKIQQLLRERDGADAGRRQVIDAQLRILGAERDQVAIAERLRQLKLDLIEKERTAALAQIDRKEQELKIQEQIAKLQLAASAAQSYSGLITAVANNDAGLMKAKLDGNAKAVADFTAQGQQLRQQSSAVQGFFLQQMASLGDRKAVEQLLGLYGLPSLSRLNQGAQFSTQGMDLSRGPQLAQNTIVPTGGAISAGFRGAMGSTGRSTGPHFHLQNRDQQALMEDAVTEVRSLFEQGAERIYLGRSGATISRRASQQIIRAMLMSEMEAHAGSIDMQGISSGGLGLAPNGQAFLTGNLLRNWRNGGALGFAGTTQRGTDIGHLSGRVTTASAGDPSRPGSGTMPGTTMPFPLAPTSTATGIQSSQAVVSANTEALNNLKEQLAAGEKQRQQQRQAFGVERDTINAQFGSRSLLEDADTTGNTVEAYQRRAFERFRNGVADGFSSLFDVFEQGLNGSINSIGDFAFTLQKTLANVLAKIGQDLIDLALKPLREGLMNLVADLLNNLRPQQSNGVGGIIGSVLGVVSGALSVGGSAFGSTSFGGVDAMAGAGGGFGSYAGPATGDWGVSPFAFANGGVIPGGFRAFATGGIITQPTLGLVGEGLYNEAVIPLPDGRSVPVNLSGAAGNAVTTNITVNVSNGQMQTEGGVGGNNLSRKLEAAVKQVIANELRPGGLIPGGRR